MYSPPGLYDSDSSLSSFRFSMNDERLDYFLWFICGALYHLLTGLVAPASLTTPSGWWFAAVILIAAVKSAVYRY